MESLITFTLFGSGIAFGIILIALFLAFIASDLSETGEYAVVATLIFIGLNYFWGDFPLLSILTLKNILLYIFSGFIFSLIRTYFKGKELTESEKKYFKLKDHVFRWWLLFPISAINWIFGRLLKDLYNWIYSKISKVYEKLFNINSKEN